MLHKGYNIFMNNYSFPCNRLHFLSNANTSRAETLSAGTYHFLIFFSLLFTNIRKICYASSVSASGSSTRSYFEKIFR